jgi:hypothetical protein
VWLYDPFARVLRPFLLATKVQWLNQFFRSLCNSLKGILEALVVTAGMMLIFAAIAVAAVPCNAQDDGGEITYNNIGLAFVNIAVLLTTENYPDVLHDTLDASVLASNSTATPGGAVQWRYVWFYIVFLMLGIFIVANMMLAIIWDIYKRQYITRILKMRRKERGALMQAYRMLTTGNSNQADGGGEIDIGLWHTFIRQLLPTINLQDAELMFMMLDISGNGLLGIHEFMKLNDLIKLYYDNPDTLHVPSQDDEQITPGTHALRVLVSSSTFESASSMVICICGGSYMFRTKGMSSDTKAVFDAIVMVSSLIFAIELGIRTWAFGLRKANTNWFVMADTAVISLVVVKQLLYLADLMPPCTPWWCFDDLEVLLMFRVMRVWYGITKDSNQYNLLVTTLVATLPLGLGMASTLILIMYAFAILGMELFHTVPWGAYPYENFSDFPHSMLALFQVLMINNWNDLLTHTIKHTNATVPSIFFLAYMFFSVLIVANLISAMFLTVFNTTQERIAMQGPQSYLDSSPIMGSIEGQMMSAIVAEQRDEFIQQEARLR